MSRPAAKLASRYPADATVTLAHGSGGKAMRDLINDIFVCNFANDQLTQLEDQARLDLDRLREAGRQLAFTTDSFVVDPLFFPGGDIGKLAVCGTVNDLAVGGADALYLSCSAIVEEGLPIATLRDVAVSMREAAGQAGVQIVTGDTKVVPRGAVDKLFLNTAGVGVIRDGTDIAATHARPGDAIVVNGHIGDHGAAIADTRDDMGLDYQLESDCRALNHLVAAMLDQCPDIHCLRDATRGGLATVLNEFAAGSGVAMQIDESALPVRAEVRGFCELLGLDPLYLANEGKLVAVLPGEHADATVEAMRRVPGGEGAAIIGRVAAEPAGRVILKTSFGGSRIVDMLIGDQLPRIC